MPTTAFYTGRGHTEVGHVDGGDNSWGKTQEDGIEVQAAVTAVDLFSAQSTMEEDTGITRTSLSILIRLIDASLQSIQRLFGIPDSEFTGDLTAATPTAEVLDFEEGLIGSTERVLYSLGPGPSSTRRIDVPRAKVADLGSLAQSKVNWMLPQATWRVLNPAAGGHALRITDAT